MALHSWIRRHRKDNPRWVVLLIDLWIVFLCYILANFVIGSFKGRLDYLLVINKSIVVVAVYFLIFFCFKTYRGIIRQSGLRDMQLITVTVAISVWLLMMISLLVRQLDDPHDGIGVFLRLSYAVLFTHATLTIVCMVAARIIYREIYEKLFWRLQPTEHVLLIGAGNMGNITYNLLHNDVRARYKVVGFADDNLSRIGKRIHGFRILDLAKLDEEIVHEKRIQHIIIAIDDNSPQRMADISSKIEPLPANLKVMPSSAKLLSGEVATRQLRPLRIDDLLGRDAIKLDNPAVHESLTGKTVLITGSAGSIGGELARQIAFAPFSNLILLDQAESALYDLQQELNDIATHNVHYVVGNVRDLIFMGDIFDRYQPDVVFHVAAYKHVPLMEKNPYEAIRTNVCGSKNVADLADRYGVEKFVMVSTDKAVNPTNVMGATKRIAEIYVSALNQQSNTNYIVTRFGNVLGSNGSVIPLFEKQLERGGPLTVTHTDISRYFMTIPEACQLVQEAAVMGTGGEIYVFDMGEPVKIMDLAQRMIRLRGFRYPQDVRIDIIGLRPGEKKFEELLANDENTIKTHHEKILIAQVNNFDLVNKKLKIEELCNRVQDNTLAYSPTDLVAFIKKIVPEYISQNSIYEQLETPDDVDSVI